MLSKLFFLQTTILNKHLHELMEGLTAKVFRTYNASHTLQEQLNLLTNRRFLKLSYIFFWWSESWLKLLVNKFSFRSLTNTTIIVSWPCSLLFLLQPKTLLLPSCCRITEPIVLWLCYVITSGLYLRLLPNPWKICRIRSACLWLPAHQKLITYSVINGYLEKSSNCIFCLVNIF